MTQEPTYSQIEAACCAFAKTLSDDRREGIKAALIAAQGVDRNIFGDCHIGGSVGAVRFMTHTVEERTAIMGWEHSHTAVVPSLRRRIVELTAATGSVREAVAWCSPGQLANLMDVDADGGVYLPIRKTNRGNFTMPLFAAAPTPDAAAIRPDSWAVTPKDAREQMLLLAEVELHLQSCRVFLTTREKMHPCGVDLHDELLVKVTAAIETIGREKANG